MKTPSRCQRRALLSFLIFSSRPLPEGDVYLFGGVLRDLALLGGRGFNSDIDVVVEGDWASCTRYLDHLGARRNKFGGYRLEVATWKVDIWNARETWAISHGLVQYNGIAALTKTTVLNWDAVFNETGGHEHLSFVTIILMTSGIGHLDVVLEQNPNPAGMAMRVFRHLCLKEALSITPKAITYLANCTALFRPEGAL
jgi:hypothetical protein